jgi:hypothetical protein
MQTYGIQAHVRGDTWGGLLLSVRTGTGEEAAPPAVALAAVRMQVRDRPDGRVLLELTSAADGGITFNAATWDIEISRRVVDIAPGHHYYDIEMTDAEGTIRTYLSGRWLIHRDVTR